MRNKIPAPVTPVTHTIIRKHIAETVIPGQRLGRHIYRDSRSARFAVVSDGTVASASWARDIPILNQGNVGACTANAATGLLASGPLATVLASLQASLNEQFALTYYSDEETLDGDGPYPPNDNGSTGLTAGKVALARGYISAYRDITSVAQAQTAIQTGPFIMGSNWFTSFDTPASSGLVSIAKGATVRGGHEYLIREYDAVNDLWWPDNSWGPGWGLDGRFCYSSATLKELFAQEGDATYFEPTTPTPVPTPTPDVASLADIALNTALDEAKRSKSTPKYLVSAIDTWQSDKQLS